MSRRLPLVPLLFALAVSGIAAAHAMTFTDVSNDYVYASAIAHLSDQGIITGNPDGTFAPKNTVNRAEFLTMLYRAEGMTPTATAVCMRDVIAGSWYLSVVCDAVAKGYVGGYPDGTFKPQNPVNRAEAAKMLLTVMGFPIGDFTSQDSAAIGYPDVSLDAWYTKFLAAAFRNGILPVAGQNPNAFGPEAPLTRGEAAAYIDSALRVRMNEQQASSMSSMQEEQSSAAVSQSSASSSSQGDSVMNVSFPLAQQTALSAKGVALYHFSISQKTVDAVTVTLYQPDPKASCTLYKLGDNSLPSEYYVGSVDTLRCFLRVSLSPGDYQFEVHGTASQYVSIATLAVTGDGDDSDSEAKTLVKNSMRIGQLEVDDSADYYTFKVTQDQTPLYIDTSNSSQIRCTIVPMNDVNIDGFTNPDCNMSYAFPTGTYIVVIDRKPGQAWARQDYGVILKDGTK